MDGIKAWLAKKAGPSAYGNQIGNAAVENGTLLGRVLYTSHGVKSGIPGGRVFNSLKDMTSAGFQTYSTLNAGYTSKVLSGSIGACIAFSSFMATNAACKFFRHDRNKQLFCEWTGRAIVLTMKKEAVDLVPITLGFAEFLSGLPEGGQLVNLENPGFGDIFFRCLEEVGRQAGNCTVGFPQEIFGGSLIDLANQTVLGVSSAATQFDW